jgi:hypothetical protein
MKGFNGVKDGAKKVITFAVNNGWQVGKTRKNHYLFERPGCRDVTFSLTTSDYRAALNCISKLRQEAKALNDRPV